MARLMSELHRRDQEQARDGEADRGSTAHHQAAAPTAARRDGAASIGEELWDHQLKVVRSSARYRVVCAGRRAGKTRTFGDALAPWTAFAQPRAKARIVSGRRCSEQAHVCRHRPDGDVVLAASRIGGRRDQVPADADELLDH